MAVRLLIRPTRSAHVWDVRWVQSAITTDFVMPDSARVVGNLAAHKLSASY